MVLTSYSESIARLQTIFVQAIEKPQTIQVLTGNFQQD
jgi:hypothetical protein